MLSYVAMPKPYKQLSQNEREEFAKMFMARKSLGEITETLNRAKSIIFF
jgi:IS30 family transposase